MKDKNRIIAYDLMKVIAIFLVCFYHVGKLNINFLADPSTPVFFNYFIYSLSSMGVPLFFMVNGALLLNKENYDFKKHIIKTGVILVLLIVWGCLSLVLMYWLNQEHFTLAEFISAFLKLKGGYINHLWFLKAIIYLHIFFPFVKALFDSNKQYAFCMMLIIFIFTFSHLPYLDWINPFQGYYSYALVYFMLGGFLVEYSNDCRIKNWQVYVLFFVALSLLFLFGIYKTEQTHLLYDTVWEGYDMVMVLIMAVSAFVWCKRINLTESMKNIICLLGTYTLGIYFVHILVDHFCALFFPMKQNNLLIAIAYSLVILLIAFVLSWMGKKIPLLKHLFQL